MEATTSFSPTLRLLLACVRPPPHALAENEIRALCRAKPDWQQFLVLTSQHRVAPLVSHNLAQLELPGLPEATRQGLARRAEANTRRALLQAAELARLAPRFQAAGVRLLLLKGPAMAMQAYGDLTLRHAGDLDLLVTPESLKQAEAILQDAGYRRTWPAGALSPRREALLHRYAAETAFRHRQHGLEVELHWRWIHNEHLFPLPFDTAWQRAEPIRLGATEIFAPVTMDHLLYAAAHGAKHGWARIQWLCDLPALMSRSPGIESEVAYARAEQLGIAPLLAQGLLLTRRALSLPSSPEPGQQLDAQANRLRHLVALPYRGLSSEDVDFWGSSAPLRVKWQRLAYLLRLRPEPAYRRRTLACYATSFEDLEALPLPDRLLPLCLLLRPFLWLVRQRRSDRSR
jgi:hypothetical protein